VQVRSLCSQSAMVSRLLQGPVRHTTCFSPMLCPYCHLPCRGYTRKEPFANLFGGLPWTATVENWNGR
jgi:hypothetical protein